MAHVVVGYPNLEESFDLVRTIVDAGVDLMELQIPFSEPIADGPVILSANQTALGSGLRVDDCLSFAHRVVHAFPIPFLFMTYYNIVFSRGEERFFTEARQAGIRGAIVPDLPPEEGESYLAAAAANDVDPIFIFSPTSSPRRLSHLARFGRGFVYCVARRGVTGARTVFASQIEEFLAQCREATSLPLALGFGVSSREEVRFLQGKVEVAVVGSQALRVFDTDGMQAVGDFFRSLR
jgi:tryptophan synthase alpha chain